MLTEDASRRDENPTLYKQTIGVQEYFHIIALVSTSVFAIIDSNKAL